MGYRCSVNQPRVASMLDSIGQFAALALAVTNFSRLSRLGTANPHVPVSGRCNFFLSSSLIATWLASRNF
jgi:hypothetical protein